MSAGGLSYSMITNNGKVSLPSVDSWSTNLNILRDPPKSIMTRKKERVGDTNSVSHNIEESGDRSCEAIQVYARGVNPFVSVSYSNHGNNGGNRSGGIITGGQRAAKLPFPVLKDGAFRPEIRPLHELVPLSRRPRNHTKAFSKKCFIDFSRKLRGCGTSQNTKETKTQTLKACVRPTAVYKMENPISEPFEVKYVIQPSINVSANSGVRTLEITQQNVGIPTKEVDNNPLRSQAVSNVSDNRYINNNDFDHTRYIQETNNHQVFSNFSSNNNNNNDIQDIFDMSGVSVQDIKTHNVKSNFSSNKHRSDVQDIFDLSGVSVQDIKTHNVESNFSSNKHHTDVQDIFDLSGVSVKDIKTHNVESNFSSNKHRTDIQDIFDLSDMPVQDIRNKSTSTAVSGVEQTKYFHDDIKLKRQLPEYNVTTNLGNQNVYKSAQYDNKIELSRNTPLNSFTSNPVAKGFHEQSSREVHLLDKIKAGGFSIPGQIPTQNRIHNINVSNNSEKSTMGRMISENMQGRF